MLSLPGYYRRWADLRLLPLTKTECGCGQAFPGQDAAIEYDSRVPAGHQHRQGTSSGQGNIRAEGGGNLPSDGGAPSGEIPEQRSRGRSWPVETNPGTEGGVQKSDVCLPDVERDGSDAFITERSGHDVCLWAPQSGRGDRQPGLRDGLRTPARSGHQEMRNWVVSALRPTLQQHHVAKYERGKGSLFHGAEATSHSGRWAAGRRPWWWSRGRAPCRLDL